MDKKFSAVFSIILLQALTLGQAGSVTLLNTGGISNITLSNQPRGLYEPYKARNVGDVITIRVIENVEALKRSEITTLSSVDSDTDLRFSQASTTTSTLTPDTNDIANMITDISIPVEFSRDSIKDIDVNNRESFVTIISALVVEVDPASGNMVVEGTRQILMEGQTKSLFVRGVVFPKDIDSNNELPSYKLANAQVQIIGSGALTKQRDTGILQKIFGAIF